MISHFGFFGVYIGDPPPVARISPLQENMKSESPHAYTQGQSPSALNVEKLIKVRFPNRTAIAILHWFAI